jgi:hypothetical protein
VLPVSRNGRPEEKPSASITATLGLRSERRTSMAVRRFFGASAAVWD